MDTYSSHARGIHKGALHLDNGQQSLQIALCSGLQSTVTGQHCQGIRVAIYLPACRGQFCDLLSPNVRWCSSNRTIQHHRLNTVEPVLKDHPFGHKNVVSQDSWSLVTGSVVLKCWSDSAKNVWPFKTGVLPWQWSLKTGFTVHVHRALFKQLWLDCKRQNLSGVHAHADTVNQRCMIWPKKKNICYMYNASNTNILLAFRHKRSMFTMAPTSLGNPEVYAERVCVRHISGTPIFLRQFLLQVSPPRQSPALVPL